MLAEVEDFKIGESIINKVRFADNTAIIVKTQEELQDMVNRLVATGRKYGMEINIDKSQVMRVSKSNESLQIKVNSRELKQVDHFKYLGSVLTRDGYCRKEIKLIFSRTKEACNIKISPLTSKLHFDVRMILVRCYFWNIGMYGSETWTLGKLERKYLEIFKMWCCRRMEKKKWSEKVTKKSP